MYRLWEGFIGALPPMLGFTIFTPLGIFRPMGTLSNEGDDVRC
jgi:hypothetical protein